MISLEFGVRQFEFENFQRESFNKEYLTKLPNLLVCLVSKFRLLFGVFQRMAGLSQSETSSNGNIAT